MSKLKSVTVRDIDVAFRLDGPSSAPVVMLSHGILACSAMWDGVCELIAPKWRVLRYDLRGHGGTSSSPAPYTMTELAQDAIGLLDELGLEKVHFVGSSLGGMVGQRLGALHSSRLHTLTLANTTAVQGTPLAWQQRIAIAREQGVSALVEPTIQRWFTSHFLASGSAVIEKMRTIAAATSPEGFVGCASAIRDLSQATLLRDIGVPTLVIAGEHDEATPLLDARFIADRICGSSLLVLPAAHQSAAECPEAFAASWHSFAAPPAT